MSTSSPGTSISNPSGGSAPGVSISDPSAISGTSLPLGNLPGRTHFLDETDAERVVSGKPPVEARGHSHELEGQGTESL